MMNIIKFSVCLFTLTVCLSFSCLSFTCLNAAALEKVSNEKVSKVTTQNSQKINWQNYEDGMARGKSESKKVLINFYADWCRYCKEMDKKTFKDESVISYINENFVSIKVNSDKNKKLAQNYNVRGLPATWFIAETGENIGNRPGYMSPEDMLNVLKYIYTDSYKKMNFSDFMKKM
ncbi:thioredoxin family protein [Desulfobacterales bacterium HSG17]|nr:thioredoxin family protein [Desulfobacterales bacterium HSG17]